MERIARLIKTKNQYDNFSALLCELDGKVNDLDSKNLVFSEEKISLMAERAICSLANGTFNTEVFSFGNYLSCKKRVENALTKEGSTMVVMRVLNTIELSCYKNSKNNLSPKLYDLIIQLKSAKISPNDLKYASENVRGVLKNKLCDLYAVYNEYEEFLSQNNLIDQSSLLSLLPGVIENDNEIAETDVYLLGYSSWTRQAREVVSTLLKKAKSVTAILTVGDNEFAFVNETATAFETLCRENGMPVTTKEFSATFSKENKIIREQLLNPFSETKNEETDKILSFLSPSTREEILTVGETIKRTVIDGKCRYKDVTVCVPDVNGYYPFVREIFERLEIPYFLDKKETAENHPLVNLINDYVSCFIKKFSIETLISFIKNPLVCNDKRLTDAFEKYLIKYNVNYIRFKKPFSPEFAPDEDLEKFELLRQELLPVLERFNVQKMFNDLSVKEKIEDYTLLLEDKGERVKAQVNAQIYQAIEIIFEQIQMILGQTKVEPFEFKKIFESGISALKLSVIPEYNDAVFIGSYREVSLAKAKYLFATGLTSSVPIVTEDVALLTDEDINTLSNIKVMVEPKIKIVNKRAIENTVLALSSFDRALIISYPRVDIGGTVNAPSEIIIQLRKLFTVKNYSFSDGYLTKKQGLLTFAKTCGKFVENKEHDLSKASAYYAVNKQDPAVLAVLSATNKQFETRLDGGASTVSDKVSPTLLEEFYTCPYRAFLSRTLSLKERDEGKITPLSVGNFAHLVFEKYLANVKKVKDLESSNSLVDEIVKEQLTSPEYVRYLQEKDMEYGVNEMVKECKHFCYKIYEELQTSKFKPYQFEKGFSVPLEETQVKLTGKIDRIDECDGAVRIIDYKTGKVDPSEKSLFSGTKLQLYLYALALPDKKVEGVYYLPVAEPFMEIGQEKRSLMQGRTIAEEPTGEFSPFAVSSEETFLAYTNYALAMCVQAVKQMQEGIIVPSPYGEACEYCAYKSICSSENLSVRKIRAVNEQTIIDSVTEVE